MKIKAVTFATTLLSLVLCGMLCRQALVIETATVFAPGQVFAPAASTVLLPLIGVLATIVFLMAGRYLLGLRTPRNLISSSAVASRLMSGLRFVFGSLHNLFLPKGKQAPCTTSARSSTSSIR